MNKKSFNKIIFDFFLKNKREMPWRYNSNPYHILVSEIMLQQTQVQRVIPKYFAFLKEFPTIQSLGNASLSKIYKHWSGLGYNRRARYIQQTAKEIVAKFDGHIPQDVQELLLLPGIGKATAGAIVTYAFNIPTIFIETNIRTTLLHFMFANYKEKVNDKSLESVLEILLDRHSPRDWYYAVVDYGAMLKSSTRFTNTQSSHYVKQKKFIGSDRQIRGAIMKLVSESGENLTKKQITKILTNHLDSIDAKRMHSVLESLIKDSLIVKRNNTYYID